MIILQINYIILLKKCVIHQIHQVNLCKNNKNLHQSNYKIDLMKVQEIDIV